MIERTAAGLESCQLQRVLSKPARRSKRCRQLHTGFWQHGASAIEISSSWPVAPTAREPVPDQSPSPPPQPTLLASTFLLDFLYPNATFSLLRRLYPNAPATGDSLKARNTKSRQFTSSSVDVASDDRHAAFAASETSRTTIDQHTQSDRNIEPSIRPREASTAPSIDSNALETLLDGKAGERPNEVWDLFTRKDSTQQSELQVRVLAYLSASDSVVQCGRALSIFNKYSTSEWNDDILTAGVRALVQSDLPVAVSTFTSGLEINLTSGIEHIIKAALSTEQWALATDAWLKFFQHMPETAESSLLSDQQLELLQGIPNLLESYISLQKHIKNDAQMSGEAANTRGLLALRRTVALAILRQPCSTKQAIPILDTFRDRSLYEEYIMNMLGRLSEGMEHRSGALSLGQIYKAYRDLPGTKQPREMLRGMFDVYFPSDPAGLEMVYRDWHRNLGELDQWAFEKFLKFYAASGDVAAVKNLWARYVAAFPEALKQPRAFRSTMNVYAQTGDVERAEQEMQRMTDEYNVAPDLDTWNALLKCYMRASQSDKTMQCFEEICQLHEPDSFTFAHAMAMSAKNGDIDTTLDLFNKSQTARVPVSREMTMALVLVYLKNERLHDAESICSEFATRGATSTTIWNQLIHYNGLHGKLSKCYELLRTMKDFGIDWDDQTHEFLLQSLVKVDQIQPAYQLLQRAYEDKLFPVGTEQFAIVLGGAVRVGDTGLVESLTAQMRREGLPTTFNSQVVLADASFRQAPTSLRTRNLTKGVVEQLRTLMPSTSTTSSTASRPTPPGDVAELKMKTRNIARAVSLLIQMREFEQASEVVTLYSQLLPPSQGFETPTHVTASLLRAYLEEGHHEQVLQLWKQTWDRMLARNTQKNSRTVFPAYEYELSQLVALVACSLRELNDAEALYKLTKAVTDTGFKLTRNTWNLVIRHLADMGHWEPAMYWCESNLMPRWRGWTPQKRSLQERRDLKNARVLAASRSTVLSLQRQWLRLRKLSAWSADVSAKLNHIERNYPALHYAFITTDYEHLPDSKDGKGKVSTVGRQQASLTRGASQVLKPMQMDELKSMEKSLERTLMRERKLVDDRKGRERRVPLKRVNVKFKPRIF